MHFVEYLNTPKVLEAIGAYQNFSVSSEAVWTAFSGTGDDDREAGTVEAIGELLEQGVTVMLYAGDADYKYVFFILFILFAMFQIETDGGETRAG